MTEAAVINKRNSSVISVTCGRPEILLISLFSRINNRKLFSLRATLRRSSVRSWLSRCPLTVKQHVDEYWVELISVCCELMRVRAALESVYSSLKEDQKLTWLCPHVDSRLVSPWTTHWCGHLCINYVTKPVNPNKYGCPNCHCLLICHLLIWSKKETG